RRRQCAGSVLLGEIGRWPWPRRTLGDLVKRIRAAGATVIAFDFVFPDAEQDGPCALPAATLSSYGFTEGCKRLTAEGTGDAAFAEAIGAGNVVLGLIGRVGAVGGTPSVPVRAGFVELGDNPKSHVPGFTAITQNVGALQGGASGFGALNWFPLQDQIVRSLPLLVRIGSTLTPSLSAEALRVALGADTIVVRSASGSGEAGFGGDTGLTEVMLGELPVSVDARGQVWLPFAPYARARYVSAADVLKGRLPENALRDRIVLIGTSAAGLFDLQATPLDAAVPGVEIHAQAIEQLARGETLVRPDFAAGLEITLTTIAALILAATTYFGGARLGAVLGAVAVASVIGLAWFAFTQGRTLIDPLFPVIAMTGVYLVGSGILYVQAEADRNQVRSAFESYMAPELVKQLLRQPDRLQLGGETRELTIMFSDVRGFTAVAEGFHDNPQGLTALMNRLLTPLTNAIISRAGTVDKYMGDAILAFWNAPLDDPSHPDHACAAALDMIAALNA
ncbi:MAG: adenylate/guanylate cyclase domain-containing protein, partial [Pseudomonadota bacterium]